MCDHPLDPGHGSGSRSAPAILTGQKSVGPAGHFLRGEGPGSGLLSLKPQWGVYAARWSLGSSPRSVPSWLCPSPLPGSRPNCSRTRGLLILDDFQQHLPAALLLRQGPPPTAMYVLLKAPETPCSTLVPCGSMFGGAAPPKDHPGGCPGSACLVGPGPGHLGLLSLSRTTAPFMSALSKPSRIIPPLPPVLLPATPRPLL